MRTISLEEAVRVLCELWGLSGAGCSVSTGLTPDWVADSARAAGFDVSIERTANWERRSDEDLFEELSSGLGEMRGDVLLVTEASFGPAGGAFLVEASEMRAAMREHQESFEPVFNGDVILAVLQRRVVICLHHESFIILATPPTESPRGPTESNPEEGPDRE
jgi:hypothetical protein